MTGKSKATDGALELEWREITAARSDEDPRREPTGDYEADTPFGPYYIEQYFGSDSYGWYVSFADLKVADKDDPEAAKAAAQADFDTRIRSSLAALPPPTGEPAAWMFELANARNTETDEPCNWGKPQLSFTPPSAGKYQRNITPLFAAPSQVEPAEGETWREFDHETIDYVLRYGGRCRDCADHHGLCPSGLPCDVDDAKTAIRWVLKALNYGIVNGFVPSPRPSQSAAPLSLRRKVEEVEAERDEAADEDAALSKIFALPLRLGKGTENEAPIFDRHGELVGECVDDDCEERALAFIRAVNRSMTVKELYASIRVLKLSLKQASEWRDQFDCCMCGSPMDSHDIGSGHSPVSMYDYHQDQLVKRAEAAEAELLSLRRKVEEQREAIIGLIGKDSAFEGLLFGDFPDDNSITITAPLGDFRRARAFAGDRL